MTFRNSPRGTTPPSLQKLTDCKVEVGEADSDSLSRRVVVWLSDRCQGATDFFQGAAAAILLIQAIAASRFTIGISVSATASLIIASLLGWSMARWLSGWTQSTSWMRRLACVTATAATIWTPSVADSIAGRLLGMLSIDQLGQTGIVILVQLVVLLPTLSLVSFGLTFAVAVNEERGATPLGFSVFSLAGIAIACLFAPGLLMPVMASRLLSLMMLAGLLATLSLENSKGRSLENSMDEHCPTIAGDTREKILTGWLTAFLSGLGVATATAITAQLMPRTLMTEFSVLAGLVAGMAIGFRLSTSLTKRVTTSDALIGLAAWGIILFAGYPLWTGWILRTAAFVTSLPLIVVLKAGLPFLLTFPVGVVLSIGHRPYGFGGKSTQSLQTIGLVAMGYVAAALSGFAVLTIGLIVVVVSLIAATGLSLSRRGQTTGGRLGDLRVPALAIVTLATVVTMGNFNPSRSERVLFSPIAVSALRNGVPVHQLTALDDGRFIGSIATGEGRLSAWIHRGTQILFRKDGISSEYRSTNTMLAPHSAADVVPSVFGLTAHPAVNNVLVLGLHTPTLTTCQQFPVQEIHVIERNTLAPQFAESVLGDSVWWSDDDRVSFHIADPLLATAARPRKKFDLILAPQAQSVTLEGSLLASETVLRRIRSHLAEEGIFCQRLAYYDLGPRVVLDLVETFHRQFPNMLITESIPGELILTGSISPQPLLTREMADRLQTPQARRVLAEVGLDWASVMGRGALDSESTENLVQESSEFQRMDATQLAFTIPSETVRWGDKALQTRQRLSQHGRSMAILVKPESLAQEVDQRLEDLRLAQQIQTEHPDQPWAYRPIIKRQLTDRPRSAIVQVKGEGLKNGLHPEDQRRKDYLWDLGMVSKQEHPPLSEILELQEYTEPFDPLLSLFVHYEVARLLGRIDEASAQDRFEQLVHTVYHASATDVSVRNICAAIELLCHDSKTVVSQQERWDHLNGLMEALSVRWQMRLRSGRKLEYEQVDLDHTVKAAKLALKTMDTLRPDIGVSENDWEIREQIFESRLMEPLHRRRGQLLKRVTLAPQKREK